MVDHDLFGVKFEKVQAAAPEDEPDDAVAVVGGQLGQPLGSSLQDRLMGVLK